MTNIHLAERDPQHHRWASDGVAKQVPPLRLRILLSFHYYQDTDLDALFAKYFTPPYPEVFLDSGGFSAMTKGTTIDLNAYCAFITRFRHLLTTYANLDVIGDAQKTQVNQQRMEDKGLSPLPVFHVNEPISYLEGYLAQYPYIALGGMVPYMRDAKKRLIPWMLKCFKLAQGKAVFHGFGCTSWEVMKALPWYSVDSSSWGAGFRFGQVPLFDEQRGRFVDIKLGNHAECFAKASLIRGLGFDPADFADRARNDRAKICAISALSYLKAEQWLRRRHGAIYIPTRQDGISVLKSHLAAGGVLGTPDAPNGEYPRGLGMVHDALVQDAPSSRLKVHLVDSHHTHLRDMNFASKGIEATDTSAVLRTYLADTSNGINYRDADAGLKMHLVTAHGGEKDGQKGSNTHVAALSQAGIDTGLKIYLADARGQSGSDLAAADDGLRIYLAEHSLDRGG